MDVIELPWWHYLMYYGAFTFIGGVIVLCGCVLWLLIRNDQIVINKETDE